MILDLETYQVAQIPLCFLFVYFLLFDFNLVYHVTVMNFLNICKDHPPSHHPNLFLVISIQSL